MDLFVNGTSLGQQDVNAIVQGSYLAKGSDQRETFEINNQEALIKSLRNERRYLEALERTDDVKRINSRLQNAEAL